MAKNGMCLGIVGRNFIDMGPYKFDCIKEHKNYINNVYGIDKNIVVIYDNSENISYHTMNTIDDILYRTQYENMSETQ